MKRKYLYIAAGEKIDERTRFFVVWVGSGKTAISDYLAVLSQSVSKGHYFEMWSTQVDTFLRRIDESLFGKRCSDHLLRINLEQIQVHTLAQVLKKNLPLPLQATISKESDYFRTQMDIDYRIMENLKRRTHK